MIRLECGESLTGEVVKKKGLIILALIGGVLMFFFTYKEDPLQPLATEQFIEKWLKNENGTLATYMKDSDSEDEDLVKGREALSESLGLWMEYTLQKEDKVLFEEAYQQLNRYFLDANGFVHWKLTETGESEVSTNALVDDFRIIEALFQASEKWNEEKYETVAIRISEYITTYNDYQNVLTDFYDQNYQYARNIITLSYIEPEALKSMEQRQLLDRKVYENMLDILKDAPTEGPFFPKSFNVQKKEYLYDQNINMIDQSLVAYYRAKSGFSTKSFAEFIRKELQRHGVIFGQYDRVTKKPVVEYESPAIYGWLILYCKEAGEEELARKLFKEMTKFRTQTGPYKGGYSVYQEDTHIFDNLVPLLAEI